MFHRTPHALALFLCLSIIPSLASAGHNEDKSASMEILAKTTGATPVITSDDVMIEGKSLTETLKKLEKATDQEWQRFLTASHQVQSLVDELSEVRKALEKEKMPCDARSDLGLECLELKESLLSARAHLVRLADFVSIQKVYADFYSRADLDAIKASLNKIDDSLQEKLEPLIVARRLYLKLIQERQLELDKTFWFSTKKKEELSSEIALYRRNLTKTLADIESLSAKLKAQNEITEQASAWLAMRTKVKFHERFAGILDLLNRAQYDRIMKLIDQNISALGSLPTTTPRTPSSPCTPYTPTLDPITEEIEELTQAASSPDKPKPVIDFHKMPPMYSHPYSGPAYR